VLAFITQRPGELRDRLAGPLADQLEQTHRCLPRLIFTSSTVVNPTDLVFFVDVTANLPRRSSIIGLLGLGRTWTVPTHPASKPLASCKASYYHKITATSSGSGSPLAEPTFISWASRKC